MWQIRVFESRGTKKYQQQMLHIIIVGVRCADKT